MTATITTRSNEFDHGYEDGLADRDLLIPRTYMHSDIATDRYIDGWFAGKQALERILASGLTLLLSDHTHECCSCASE